MPSLTITTIQTDLHWENKRANLRMLEEKIASLQQRTEVIFLPEMFATGFTMNPEQHAETMQGEVVTWMQDISQRYGCIICGTVAMEDGGRYYNRLIWQLPNNTQGIYDKRHLFAFAGEHEHYTAGQKRLIASVKGWKLNLQICYDLRFPVWARQQPATANDPEYDVLVYLANWPERRSHAWKTLLCARAIENQCYVVGVNRVGKDGNDVYHSGNSLVISPMGEVLYHVADEEDICTMTLEKEKLMELRERLPFLKDGDAFSIIQP